MRIVRSESNWHFIHRTEIDMKHLLFSLLGLALCGTLGCSGDASSSESEGQVAQPIINGATDRDDPSVVGIILTDAEGNSFICSGSVIAPTKVLTARHCVKDMVSWEVRLGVDIRNPDATLAVSGGAFSQDGDIGLLTLSEPTNLVPLPYNTTALTRRDVGAAVRAVGYGSNKTNAGEGTGAGTKRTGNTTIKGVQGGADTFSTHYIVCHGDSGGPIFDNGTIIGVSSYVNPANCTNDGYSVRTDLYADFIRAN